MASPTQARLSDKLLADSKFFGQRYLGRSKGRQRITNTVQDWLAVAFLSPHPREDPSSSSPLPSCDPPPHQTTASQAWPQQGSVQPTVQNLATFPLCANMPLQAAIQKKSQRERK